MTTATLHETVARDRKVTAALAFLDKQKNRAHWSDDDLYRIVSRFDRAAWERLASASGQRTFSDESRRALLDRLRSRLDGAS